MVIEFVAERFGHAAIGRVLSDLADDVPINAALAKHTEPIEKLDASFAAWLKQQAEELAELQKQIINATWKVIRRETKAEPTKELAGDGKLLERIDEAGQPTIAARDEILEFFRMRLWGPAPAR